MENEGVVRSTSRLLTQAKRKIQKTIRKPSLLKIVGILLALLLIMAHAHYNPAEVDPSAENTSTAHRSDELTNHKRTKKVNRSNIIIIVADDLGYNDVSYHGSEINTPHIDWLATNGVRLDNYYVQPDSTATRSQLLSGRYQIHTGLHHDNIWPAEPRGLPLDSPTLADKLKEVGYATHMVGKWHLGYFKKEYIPTSRGFNSFFGFLNDHGDYYTHRTTFKKWSGYDLRENEKPADVEKYNGTYATHLITDRVIDIIKAHDQAQSLFLYISFKAPQTPIQVPYSYVKPYEDSIPDLKRRKYAGLVSCMDEAVGNITKVMKQTGLIHNSLIIFTTDNGADERDGGSNTPLRGQKRQYFEGGIRAVGFMYSKWLQNKMAGKISTELVHVTDWFPTLVNIGKGSLNGTKPLDGYDQWGTIINGKLNKRSEILINIDPLSKTEGQPLFDFTFDTRISASLRMDEWKIITGYPGNGLRSKKWNETYRAGAENVWLFNIQRDPNETTDVSDKHRDIVQVMLGRLGQYYSTSVPAILKPIDANADPAMHNGFWGPWLVSE